MKLIITTISLLIYCWSINIGSPKQEKESIGQPTISALKKSSNDDFSALWINENEQTRAITKCSIRYDNNKFYVQMWGACQPQDCDWGENISSEIKKGTDKFELIWDSGFAESSITYQIIDGKLKMNQIRRYKDDSGRQDQTVIEYFKKN